LITFSLLILTGCKEKEEVKPLEQQIESLEASFNKNPTSEVANELLVKYAEFAKANPDNDLMNSRILRRTARIYETAQEPVKAASTLVLALKKYYNEIETEANIATLVRYYEKLDNSEAAKTTMNGYLMAYPQGSKAEDYISTLGDDRISLPEKLQELAVQIVTPQEGSQGLNVDAVNQYIGVAEIFALTNHDRDTLTTDFLFKAGKLATTIGNLDKAMECYQWIYSIFPDSKEAPSAKFTHAFTLDNQMGKKEEAKVLYEEFLKDYPDHHFADDTEFQLNNLGKGDAEILEELKKKASQEQ